MGTNVDGVAEAVNRRVKRVEVLSTALIVVAAALASPLILALYAPMLDIDLPWGPGPREQLLAYAALFIALCAGALRLQIMGSGQVRIFDQEMTKAVARSRTETNR